MLFCSFCWKCDARASTYEDNVLRLLSEYARYPLNVNEISFLLHFDGLKSYSMDTLNTVHTSNRVSGNVSYAYTVSHIISFSLTLLSVSRRSFQLILLWPLFSTYISALSFEYDELVARAVFGVCGISYHKKYKWNQCDKCWKFLMKD